MAAYLTLIDGSIWFPYGIDREKNVVHPRQWQAMMNLCKHSGHISVDLIYENFGRKKEFPPDLRPYFLAEHSLRLLYSLEKWLISTFKDGLVCNKWELGHLDASDDFQKLKLEALCFNCHKVYPPGDKYSPELSEKSQSNFDVNHIRKNRNLIKSNSILVRRSLGLPIKVSPILIELNKQLQSDELYYLQHKTDEELELMKLPNHRSAIDLKTGKESDKIYPLSSEELTHMWWSKFIDLKGWEYYDAKSKK